MKILSSAHKMHCIISHVVFGKYFLSLLHVTVVRAISRHHGFQPLEAVSRYRDPQPQVAEKPKCFY